MPDPGEPGAALPRRPIPTTIPRYPLNADPARHRVQARLDAELAVVRAELPRADAKAATLLSLAGVLLGGGLAVLASAGLPAPAATAGWTAAGCVGVATVLLACAVRPRLGGGFGHVLWARARDGGELVALLATALDAGLPDRADELRWLSRALLGKYQRIGWAVRFLLAGLTAAAIAVALVRT